MVNVVDDFETGTIPAEGVPPPCKDYTTQSECEVAKCYWWSDGTCHSTEEGVVCSDYTTQATCPTGCFWYKKYFWEEEKCHDTEQNMMMDYLPFILVGAGATLIIVALVAKKPAPIPYPRPKPKTKQ